MKIAIVAVGYNRPDSMSRLLRSLKSAEYVNDRVDLIISLDKGARQPELITLAEEFGWEYGEKTVRAFPERQGLKSHILQCGDLTDEYDAVVVLEDDLIVSPAFYDYCKQMIAYYGDDDRIAGISLYKHRMNPGCVRLFEPAEGPHDVYFMQVAQSWGQCWTKKMWKGFREWFKDNSGDIKVDYKFPAYIAKWNSASWLKYFDKYVVDTDKFFVYPYKALSTNHTDVGEHAVMTNNDYQVPMLQSPMEYRLVSLDDGIKYDAFFERIGIAEKAFPELEGEILMDLMGMKTDFGNADYIISVQSLPYRTVQKIRLRYRPIEENLILKTEGEGIYIYDLHSSGKAPKIQSADIVKYDNRCISWKKALKYGIWGAFDALRRKFGK